MYYENDRTRASDGQNEHDDLTRARAVSASAKPWKPGTSFTITLIKQMTPMPVTENWSIRGDYVEACNCDVTCQCIWLEPPDDDVCTVSLAWHIDEGQYGDVDLSGLNVAMLVYTDEGVMFAPDTGWYVVLLIDRQADEKQRAALEEIYLGRAGGIWAPVAETHFETTEVATAPFTFTRDDDEFSVRVDDTVTMEVVGKVGFNDEFGTISPHPLTKSREMNTGKSTTASVSYDDEFSWDVSENNAYLGDFELANA